MWSEINGMNRQIDEERLFEEFCYGGYLAYGFAEVQENKGKPGIDGQTITQFEQRLNEELIQLQQELLNWTYKPSPVRRVEIPKADGNGVRQLGIPTVRDRVVQAGLKILLEPLFEPDFSPNSYGFRPGRSPQQAVEAAKTIINSGKPYVIDIDLANFFDRINHDRLIARMGQKIKDKRILRLIGMLLRSGAMINGVVCSSSEGTMQGGPLSPLLSNIVLDELDKELEKRGLEFCRFADDCNIFVKTPKAAERVMESVSHFIESRLKLKVNREKSQVARSEQVKFLGFTVVNGTVAIARKAINKAMQKVKVLTPRGTHMDMKTTLKEINSWYKGWSGYFRLTQYPCQLAAIEAHIRRRLRARIIDQKKRKRFLVRDLVKRGISKSQAAKTVYTNRKRWALSKTRAVEKAYPNEWFRRRGQYIRSDQREEHWFDVRLYVRLA